MDVLPIRPPQPTALPKPLEPRAPPGPSFKQVFERIALQVDQGERVVNRALVTGPGDSETRSMIALQAGVYRYVESVELCSKLVDRAAGAVRTTLQAQ